jgi:GTP-binding protein EngB required for normal cell division
MIYPIHYFKDKEKWTKGFLISLCKESINHKKYLNYMNKDTSKVHPICIKCDKIVKEEFPDFNRISHRLMNQQDWKNALRILKDQKRHSRMR